MASIPPASVQLKKHLQLHAESRKHSPTWNIGLLPTLSHVQYVGIRTSPYGSTENHRLIQPDWTSEESGQVPGSGTTYRIPANVKAELTSVKTYYRDLQIETGTSLASKLSVSSSMGVSYMGVSVNASAEYEYETTFQTDSYYGVCSMEQQAYSASPRPGAHTWNNIDPNLIS
ncbi:hypothetical protein AFLA_005090 [Aspergillus flavus NRRL3357]|nr:hypothetical protein AFLA_005090 [Aspergillus flavus NRRL3357]